MSHLTSSAVIVKPEREKRMVKTTFGCEPIVGSLMPSGKRDYRVTNRLQEGERYISDVVFNFIDSRYYNVFATVSGNRVSYWLNGYFILLLFF